MSKANIALITTYLALLVCVGKTNSLPTAVKQASITGVWLGKVTNGAHEVQFLIRFEKQGDTITGSFQIPDRSAETQPLGMIALKDRNLSFSFPVLAIKWEGKLDEAGTHLNGIASDGTSKYPLSFTIVADALLSARPQEPKEPYPYKLEVVQYENVPANISLAGTLTVPKTPAAGPFPAVILLSGNGQLDRDGASFGHKPFWVLADYLTRLGVAVLRVDDRGTGKSGGDATNATIADLASDLSAGAAYLKSHREIGKIGVIGYGTGGAIAAISALHSPDIGFMVMMGTPAQDGRRILEAQTEMMAADSGAAPEELIMIRRFQARAFGILISNRDPEAASSALVSAMTDEISKLPPGRRVGWLKLMSAMTRNYNTPWMRYFTAFNPAPILKAISVPTLALYGEQDTEVLSASNQPAMESALRVSRTRDYKVQVLPGLNHLFQSTKPNDNADYDQIQETISPTAMKTVGDWIVEHGK